MAALLIKLLTLKGFQAEETSEDDWRLQRPWEELYEGFDLMGRGAELIVWSRFCATGSSLIQLRTLSETQLCALEGANEEGAVMRPVSRAWCERTAEASVAGLVAARETVGAELRAQLAPAIELAKLARQSPPAGPTDAQQKAAEVLLMGAGPYYPEVEGAFREAALRLMRVERPIVEAFVRAPKVPPSTNPIRAIARVERRELLPLPLIQALFLLADRVHAAK